jgi:hypothetical protein
VASVKAFLASSMREEEEDWARSIAIIIVRMEGHDVSPVRVTSHIVLKN